MNSRHPASGRHLASLLLAAALAGCASVPPSKLQQESVSQPAQLTPTGILVVFDIRLEDPYLSTGGLIYTKAEALEQVWGGVRRSLAQWSKATGVPVQMVVHTSQDALPALSPTQTHLILEKLQSGIGVHSSQGTYMRDRSWSVHVVEAPKVQNEASRTLYSATYQADGISCFTMTMYGNKSECQADYLALLGRHLQKALPGSPGLKPASSP